LIGFTIEKILHLRKVNNESKDFQSRENKGGSQVLLVRGSNFPHSRDSTFVKVKQEDELNIEKSKELDLG
jgi:hypothetical protein